MDSWTDAQLAQMKLGGNDKCNAYLQQHGIDPRTPIKQKYESPVAQLYKLQLKARAEGKPIPTELPAAAPRSGNLPSSHNSSSSNSAGDPQSMERLPGESEQQYVARQTRLRDEARARMAAKFGNSGGGMGSSSMQGIGSDPSYNPRAGGYSSNNNSTDVLQTFSSGLGAALGVAGSYAGSVAAKLQSEDTLQSVKTVGSSFWGTLTSSVSSVAATLTTDEDDGLSDLQRQFASQKPTQSKYAGFGSGAPTSSGSSFGAPAASNPSFASNVVQEAPGLPGEDRNGVERLTGESDEQYVVRQTRLRDETRARMAAKFGGGGGLSSVASSPPPASARPTPPPSLVKPPSSGNNVNATDFFSSFGA
jgi:ADP-ribosylation factor GTPase-activating protein 1